MDPNALSDGDLHELLQSLDWRKRNAVIQMLAGRLRLGVRAEALNHDLAAALAAPSTHGALVLRVIKNTPAERADLRAGDIVVSINGHALDSAAELTGRITPIDGVAELGVWRRNERLTLRADLGPPPITDIHVPHVDNDLHRQLKELRRQVRELRRELDELSHR